MRGTQKLLLLTLAIIGVVFNMDNANALENELVTPTGDTEVQNQDETANSNENAITIEDVKNFIPDSIKLDMKDTDLFGSSSEDGYYMDYHSLLDGEIHSKLDTIFRNNVEFVKETITKDYPGIGESTYEQENFFVNGIKMYYVFYVEDIHTVTVSIYERKDPDYYFCSSGEECEAEDLEKTLQARKNITIEYSNSDDYNTDDEVYVKNAIKNINFNKIIDNNIDYEEWNKQYKSYITDAINDESLELYFSNNGGGSAGDYEFRGTSVAIAKNGVIYDVVDGGKYAFNFIIVPNDIVDTDAAYIDYALPKIKEIWSGYSIFNVEKLNDEFIDTFTMLKNDGNFYKISLGGDYCYEGEECYARVIIKKENSTKVVDNVVTDNASNVIVNGNVINSNDPIYTEMLDKVNIKGYNDVFGAYDLKLASGNISNDGLTITFNLGQEYNGLDAVVFRKKSDGNYEEFVKKIENGKIDVTVTELSQFMVALNGAPNNVQTSSMNVVLYSSLSIASLIGIASLIIIKKRKKIA